YRCDHCDYQFEEFQSFSEPALTRCPQCGRKKLRRLFGTGVGVIFKGSGFYETDYRSESYKQAAKADQEKATPANGNGNGKAAKSGKAAKDAGGGTAEAAGSGKSSKSAS